MLAPYTALLRTPGVRRFVIGAAVSRLGDAMFGVAVVAMVAGRGDSYQLAGAVSSVGLVVLALTSMNLGRLIDRYGQRKVTLPLVAWSSGWGAVMLVASATGAPDWTLFATYGLSGVVAMVGAMSRARWSYLLADQPERLHSAMSFEQVVDELSFVAGPAIAVGLATVVPEAGYVGAILCYAVGAVVFLSARSTEPPVDPAQHHGAALALRTPGIVVVSLVMILTGSIFGSNEVVTLAVSQHAGHKGLAGVIIALFAVGSAVSGLVYGSRSNRTTLGRALIIGALAMCLLEVPVLMASGHLALLAAALTVAGLATAPTLITSMQLAQALVPARQVNEAMGVVLTGTILGVALGSAVSGAVVQAHGARSGFWVPVVAAAGAVVVATLGARTFRTIT